jgi:hypothetical protein
MTSSRGFERLGRSPRPIARHPGRPIVDRQACVPCEPLKLDAGAADASRRHTARPRLCRQNLILEVPLPGFSGVPPNLHRRRGVRRLAPSPKHWFHRPTDEIPFDAFVERTPVDREGRSKNVDGAVDVLIGEAR